MTYRHLNHSCGHGRLITGLSDGKQLALNKILTNRAIQAYSLVHISYVQVTVVGNDKLYTVKCPNASDEHVKQTWL